MVVIHLVPFPHLQFEDISRSSVWEAERCVPGGVGILIYGLCLAAKSIATEHFDVGVRIALGIAVQAVATEAPHTDVSSSHTQQGQDKEAQGKGGTAGCHATQDRQGLKRMEETNRENKCTYNTPN